jgi:hypothetical protein
MDVEAGRIGALLLAGWSVLVAGCAPPEEDAPPPPDVSVQVAALTNLSWVAPACFGGTFTGCQLTTTGRCSDAGGNWYANWDPSMWNVCQTACGLPNPNSYCTWQPAGCSGTTFTGCAQTGRTTCSDYGSSSYPNWNDAAWSACYNACTSSNRNAYCTWKPATVVAGTFSGCAQTGNPMCTDWGNSAYPNWSSAAWSACQTACSSNCAADPTDNVADDVSLQWCINNLGTVRLRPGNPGYILASGLTIGHDNTTITSTAAPGRARIVAAAGLTNTMLQASGVSNTQISYLELDGNRPARSSQVQTCTDYPPRYPQSNVFFVGMNGGSFNYNRSTRTVCGSAFTFDGSGFTIQSNLIDDNGHGRESAEPGVPAPWADGITLESCSSTSVYNNWLTDDTDVAIVDGGGESCLIQNNVVVQLNRHVYAGIQLGNFQQGNGDHVGTQVEGNWVIGNGLMSFGIGLGQHPWPGNLYCHGGTITGNTVSGAFVDLMIDGITGASVGPHSLGAAAGPPPNPSSCPKPPITTPALYTVYALHATGTLLNNTGYTPTSALFDGCIP